MHHQVWSSCVKKTTHLNLSVFYTCSSMLYFKYKTEREGRAQKGNSCTAGEWQLLRWMTIYVQSNNHSLNSLTIYFQCSKNAQAKFLYISIILLFAEWWEPETENAIIFFLMKNMTKWNWKSGVRVESLIVSTIVHDSLLMTIVTAEMKKYKEKKCK